MGLNTNVLIIKNITNQEFIDELFNLLNLKIIRIHKEFDWSQQATFCFKNQESVAYTLINSTLYLECRYNIFLTYSKPLILQELGKKLEIFIYEISETVDISNYWIFKNGKYFNKTYGMDDFWDLSLLEGEKSEEIEVKVIPDNRPTLVEDTELSNDLEAFIEEFDYDILFSATYSLVEIENLEEKKILS